MSFAPTSFRPFTRSGRYPQAVAKSGGSRGQIGTVIDRSLGNQIIHTLSGITRDSTGTVLAGCVVDMFRTANDTLISSTVSDAAGAYTLPVSGPAGPFYLVAYKAGSPDVSGTSANTLIAI